MNKIEELIKELCPNGVEWKKLGEVCNFQNGFAFKSKLFRKEGAIIIRITNIEKNTIDLKDVVYFNKSDYKEDLSSFEVHNGDIMVAMSGATTGKIGVYKGFDTCYLNQRVGAFRPQANIKNKFLFHYLSAKVNDLYLLAGGGAQPNLSSTKLMSSLKLPVPPLPIQTEIVRILDKFVEQQEQLERLIELRKKQYEYYREEMLKPKEGEKWERKTLGEIGTFVRGNGLQKTDFREEGVGCIHYGQIYTYYGMFTNKTKSFVSPELASKLKKVEKGDIVLACTSENIEDVCMCVVWEGKETIVTGGHSSIYKHNENPRFIAYFLKSKAFEVQKIKYAYGAKVIDIKNDDLEKIYILLPSREKQDKIVDFLNKFEYSIDSLTIALEASKRRYEYYREKSLKF